MKTLYFENPTGFDDNDSYVKYAIPCLRIGPTRIYKLRFPEVGAVAWIDEKGNRWTLNRKYDSDRGSIPGILHWLCEPDTFLLTSYFHDGFCRFKGAYCNGIFTSLTRLQCDQFARKWVIAEGGTQWQADYFYRGVRLGARMGIGGNWGAGDLRKKAA